MKKNYIVIILSLSVILLLSGCGGDSTAVPVISTPTVFPTTVPVTPTPDIISTLTETEVKTSAIPAKNGGAITEGDMTVEIPPDALSRDAKIEIAKIKINNMTSSDVNEGDIYKISSGSEDEVYELQEPATVRIKADSQKMPLAWNGGEWLPMEYYYDGDTGEIVMELNCLDEDINEWTEEGEEEGTVDEPVIVGIGTSKDYQKSYISSKKHFEVYFCNESDLDYAEAIAKTLEEAYDYYGKLGYNSPIKTTLEYGTADHIYVYIYPSNSAPDYKNSSRGFAGTKGYMAFNKNLLDVDTDMGKSTCYHELLHLIQFGYGNRRSYPDWFDESMAVAMQYYAMNKNNEMYDLPGGRWDNDILVSPFNSATGYYNRYIIWSYIIKQKKPAILHNVMTKFKPGDSISKFNTVIGEVTEKDFITTFNDASEDYYTGGNFYNKSYFNKLSNRSPAQPYDYIIGRDCYVDPKDTTLSLSVKPLSVDYRIYESKSLKGTMELDFSDVSSNFRVYVSACKYSEKIYTSVSSEVVNGINSTKTIKNFGTDITEVFLILENTSLDSNANATLKMSVY